MPGTEAVLSTLMPDCKVYRQGRALAYNDSQHTINACTLPAVILHMAKYPHNVGQAVRLLSCYGVESLAVTGKRFPLEPHEGYRLPREERMRGYNDVTLYATEDPLSLFLRQHPDACPVAVEFAPNSESLPDFEHPAKPIYLFGPEDGGLPGSLTKRCHRFVKIPTAHCLNLATAVGTVLYDREAKNGR